MSNYTAVMKSIIGDRPEQQDSACYFAEQDTLFAVLCDGMGGHSGGAAASGAAVNTLSRLFRERRNNDFPKFFLNNAEAVNKAVRGLKAADGRPLGGGTTLVSCAISDMKLYRFSVGDSRLYILRGGRLSQLSEDHNYFLILDKKLKEGTMTCEEYERESRNGGKLISCMGMKKLGRINLNIKPFVLERGDKLMLTSDGLYKALDEEVIARLMAGSADAAASALLERLSMRRDGGLDNTTFIIIDIN